jgi:hypothetical protein
MLSHKVDGWKPLSVGENKRSSTLSSKPARAQPKVLKAKLTPEAAEREQRLREEIDARRAVGTDGHFSPQHHARFEPLIIG